MSYYETFSQLHRSSTPFLLGNCWDVNSAKVLEAAGYKAIGFSSHALSTALGFEDGEQLPFDLLLRMTKRVTESIKVPFTVDMEGGYSRTIDGILANIDRLHDVGVVGINLEDTIPTPVREFQKADDFKRIISAVANHLSSNNRNLFLNIRTDAFLLDMPTALAETLTRIKAYENAGASGIFVPCITDRRDIEQVVNATALPVNVMCVPDLPGFEVLDLLGVKRISMGPFLFNEVYSHAAALAQKVSTEKNLSLFFSSTIYS